MTQAARAVVRRHIVVEASCDQSFGVHRAAGRLQATGAQPARGAARRNRLRAAGRRPMVPSRRTGARHIYDRATDGAERRWARVLLSEPPHRIVFSWDIGPTRQLETNPENASEVETRFIEETADRTRVELEHPETSIATVPGGKRSPMASATTRDGRFTSRGTRLCSARAAECLGSPRQPRWNGPQDVIRLDGGDGVPVRVAAACDEPRVGSEPLSCGQRLPGARRQPTPGSRPRGGPPDSRGGAAPSRRRRRTRSRGRDSTRRRRGPSAPPGAGG